MGMKSNGPGEKVAADFQAACDELVVRIEELDAEAGQLKAQLLGMRRAEGMLATPVPEKGVVKPRKARADRGVKRGPRAPAEEGADG
jgi:hypothetical protein